MKKTSETTKYIKSFETEIGRKLTKKELRKVKNSHSYQVCDLTDCWNDFTTAIMNGFNEIGISVKGIFRGEA